MPVYLPFFKEDIAKPVRILVGGGKYHAAVFYIDLFVEAAAADLEHPGLAASLEAYEYVRKPVVPEGALERSCIMDPDPYSRGGLFQPDDKAYGIDVRGFD